MRGCAADEGRAKEAAAGVRFVAIRDRECLLSRRFAVQGGDFPL